MEFLPTPQMPTGLAEMTAKLMAERGGAWGQLAQSLGKTTGDLLHNKFNNPNLSPDQFNYLMKGAPQQLPPGTVGPSQPDRGKELFPRGISPAAQTLAEKMAASREATSRTMGAAGVKAATSETEQMIPLTPETRKTLSKKGITLPESMDSVHKSLLEKVIGDESKGASLGLRDNQFWEKQWVDTGKDMDLTNASSRTPLGVAVTNNMKAGRAIKLLNNDKMYTPQDQSLVTTDLTAMMKGGSPDELLLRQQQYGNLYTSGIELLQRITSKPQDLNLPEVRQHLRDVVKGIVEIDNQVIKDHVDTIESKRSDVISKRSKDWEKLKAKALKHVNEDSDSGGKYDDVINKVMGGK